MAVLGLGGATGYVDLPPSLEVVQDPLVIIAAAFMYCVEFMADKTPGVDSAWDTLHTFIRIPAGAMLAAGAAGPVDPAIAIAAGMLGGGVTAATHATKAGSRVLINTSPEPFSNWAASFGGGRRSVCRALGRDPAPRVILGCPRRISDRLMFSAAQAGPWHLQGLPQARRLAGDHTSGTATGRRHIRLSEPPSAGDGR